MICAHAHLLRLINWFSSNFTLLEITEVQNTNDAWAPVSTFQVRA